MIFLGFCSYRTKFWIYIWACLHLIINNLNRKYPLTQGSPTSGPLPDPSSHVSNQLPSRRCAWMQCTWIILKPSLQSRKIVFHKTGPWCQKRLGTSVFNRDYIVMGRKEFEYHSMLTNTIFDQDFLYIIIFSEMLTLEQWYVLLPLISLEKQV